MAISYKRLWKLLIDKDMKKKDLCVRAGISPASVTKMGKKRSRYHGDSSKDLHSTELPNRGHHGNCAR